MNARLSMRDLVWNRACLGSEDSLKVGDVALAALLAFHGLAMNGGVLHETDSTLARVVAC